MFTVIFKTMDGIHEIAVEDTVSRYPHTLMYILKGLEIQQIEYKVSSCGRFLHAIDFFRNGGSPYWLAGDTQFSIIDPAAPR